METSVENQTDKVFASNNDSTLDSHGGSLQMDYRRASLYNRAVLKLRNLWLFLLFREPMPEHYVIKDSGSVILAYCLMPLAVWVCTKIAIMSYVYFGQFGSPSLLIIGFFMSYLLIAYLLLQTFHTIGTLLWR